MNRTKFSQELYEFICKNYHGLKEEYQRIPKKIRLTIPFPAFCVVFWDELQPNNQTYLDQITAIFDKDNQVN
jgi:hypothetical protein